MQVPNNNSALTDRPVEPLGKLSRFETNKQDSGFVLIFSALFLTTLLAIAGFTLDLGNGYLQTLRMQRAIDAAVLAGSVSLPSDSPQAIASAKQILVDNGYSQSNPNITITTQVGVNNPGMLNIKMTQVVPTYFGRMVGLDHLTLSREATGEYRPPVPMGSPSNVLGSEPVAMGDPSLLWQQTSSRGLQDSYWLSISGGKVLKSYGDQWTAKDCVDQNDLPNNDGSAADDCPYDSSQNRKSKNGHWDNASPTNTDYIAGPPINGIPQGQQTYVVRVAPTAGNVAKTLQIELYDPEFANTGDLCERNTIEGVPDPLLPDDPARYRQYDKTTGQISPFCSGDMRQSGPQGTVPMDTTFLLTAPDGTTNSTISTCQRTYLGHEFISQGNGDEADQDSKTIYKGVSHTLNDAGYDNKTNNGDPSKSRFRFYNTDMDNAAHSADISDNRYTANDFAQNFHQWATFCSITVGGAEPVGDYVLHVLTPTNATGTNRFAIRANVDTPTNPGVSVFGRQNLVIYSNKPVDDTSHESISSFFLAQVPSSAAGSDLDITYFDIGDADAATRGNYVNISILPPTDARLKVDSTTTNPFTYSSNSCETTTATNASGDNFFLARSSVDQETDKNIGRSSQNLGGTQSAGPSPWSNCTIEEASGDGQAIPSNGPSIGQFLGKKIYMKVHIPAQYKCTDADYSNGCWFRLELDYHDLSGSSRNVGDTSSWQVNLGGRPLHLRKDSDFS